MRAAHEAKRADDAAQENRTSQPSAPQLIELGEMEIHIHGDLLKDGGDFVLVGIYFEATAFKNAGSR